MVSYDNIWYHMTSYDIIWHHKISYDILWYHMISHDIIWYHIISYDIIWCFRMSYDIIWCHMIPYDVIWYRIVRMYLKNNHFHDSQFLKMALFFENIMFIVENDVLWKIKFFMQKHNQIALKVCSWESS